MLSSLTQQLLQSYTVNIFTTWLCRIQEKKMRKKFDWFIMGKNQLRIRRIVEKRTRTIGRWRGRLVFVGMRGLARRRNASSKFPTARLRRSCPSPGGKSESMSREWEWRDARLRPRRPIYTQPGGRRGKRSQGIDLLSRMGCVQRAGERV